MAKKKLSDGIAEQSRASGGSPTELLQGKEIVGIELADLHFDPRNPRFGASAGRLRQESDVLDYIVDKFGVDDVLSSIAVNGYFSSEPILVLEERGKKIVAEGNRRLAACLILAGDPRAAGQERRQDHFQRMHQKYGSKRFQPLPAVIFKSEAEKAELIPYLGVRHIAGAQQWDSFAKAAWVADAVNNRGVKLEDVIRMIGDDTNLSVRMLHGFYVVEQLRENGRFVPEQSHHRGQKSNPDFPFSWVYTALGFKPVREWVQLPDDPREFPLDATGEDRAAELFLWMFGQKKNPPAIEESRELKDFAKAVRSPDMLRLLRSGETMKEVVRKVRAPGEQISEALTDAQNALGSAIKIIAEGIDSEVAEQNVDLVKKVRSLATKVSLVIRNNSDQSPCIVLCDGVKK